MRTVIAALVIGVAVFGAVVWLLPGRQSGDVEVVSNASPASAGPANARRDTGEGGVEIEVVYGGPQAQRYEPEKFAVFLVAMNTHTVDLSPYDMVKISELHVDGKVTAPLRWVSTSDDAHHRSGALVFPRVDSSRPVELVIKTIAGVPARTFRWTP